MSMALHLGQTMAHTRYPSLTRTTDASGISKVHTGVMGGAYPVAPGRPETEALEACRVVWAFLEGETWV